MEDVHCIICGHNRTKQLFFSESYNYPGEVFNLTKCINCELVFLNPRPTIKEMGEYYQEYYPHMYLENLENSNCFVKSVILHAAIGHARYETISNLKGKKFLEIGFGDGLFLEYMKVKQWDVYGIEVNQACVDRMKKKGFQNVFYGDIFYQRFNDESFDLIRMSHVLEHMHDPVEALTEVKRILKKNGRVVITVPNFNGYGHKLFKQYAYFLHLPFHLYFFSLPTLENLIEKVGELSIVNVHKTHSFAFYVSSIIQFLANKKKRIHSSPSASANRMAIRRLLDIAPEPFMCFLDLFGEGDVLEVEVVKRP